MKVIAKIRVSQIFSIEIILTKLPLHIYYLDSAYMYDKVKVMVKIEFLKIYFYFLPPI